MGAAATNKPRLIAAQADKQDFDLCHEDFDGEPNVVEDDGLGLSRHSGNKTKDLPHKQTKYTEMIQETAFSISV